VSGVHRLGAVDYGPYANDTVWQRGDAALYQWARSPEFVPARRYLIAEWDVLATMPLADWWGEACYDADHGTVSAVTPETDPSWSWWDHVERLPERFRSYASGFCPFGFQALSRRALDALADSRPVPGVFCELRQGTYLRAAGIVPTVRRTNGPLDVWCRPEMIAVRPGPGVWHPVKRQEESPCPDGIPLGP